MPFYVVDTNVLISYALSKNSVPGQASQRAMQQGKLLYSSETLEELTSKLMLPKFDRYISIKNRIAFIQRFTQEASRLQPDIHVRACRDPKDDMFLSLAISGNAALIISGDKDLLTMEKFQSIPIVTARTFLDDYQGNTDV